MPPETPPEHPTESPPATTPPDDAPDWLRCSSCGYSLVGVCSRQRRRGRCPECGFPFDYASLLDAYRHPGPTAWTIAGNVLGYGLLFSFMAHALLIGLSIFTHALVPDSAWGEWVPIFGTPAVLLPFIIAAAYRTADLTLRMRHMRHDIPRAQRGGAHTACTFLYVLLITTVAAGLPCGCLWALVNALDDM